MVPGNDRDIRRRFEIVRRHRHPEIHPFATLDGAVHGHEIEQVADHRLGAQRAQAGRALIVDPHMCPDTQSAGQQQFCHFPADRPDTPGCAGDENWKFIMSHVDLRPLIADGAAPRSCGHDLLDCGPDLA